MKKFNTKTVFILCLLTLSLSHAYTQSVITNGLVAYFTFNGNANDIVGTNNGVIYGGVALAPDRFGSNNSAYIFNGVDGYMDIGNPVGNSPTNLTECAWVKILSRETTAEPVSPPMDAIITKRETPLTGSGWPTLGIASGGPSTGAGIVALDADFYFNPCTGTTLTPLNTWVFLCEVCSNGVYQIFVNGQLENTISDPHPLSSNDDMDLMHWGSVNLFCNGVLDDVRIYNRALSSNEVAQLFFDKNEIQNQAPIITIQPTNVTVNIGDNASFSVTVMDILPVNYQWFKDGTGIMNATNAVLNITNVQPPNIGNYTVMIRDLGGSVISTAASLSISNVNPALWRGLAAYYPFNGNANDIVGTNNGVIYGGVALAPDRFGSNNSAYIFNGVDGYMDIGNPVGNSPTNLTECAWVKILSRETTAEPVSPPMDAIITKREIPLTGSGWPTLGIASGGPSTGAGVVALDADFYFNPCTGTTLTPLNTWVFLCEVCSNGIYQIYVNGHLENTISDPRTLSSDEDMYLMHSGAFNSHCNGVLDDVRIYNRALSSDEVAQLFASETPPHTATATATLAGAFIVGVNIIDGGAGYTNTPFVRLIGGGGNGAQAFAVVSNGVVVAINVINAGFGYTNAPQVVIDPPYIFNPILGIAPMSFLTFSNVTVGGSYQLQQFQSYFWTNQSVSFTASNAVYTQMVSGVAGNADYRLALAPPPVQAFATPHVVNGFVVGTTVTAGGSGYVTSPTVNIIADVGTNATAMANISGGVVTSITIINAGMGYTNQVAIQIDPPPAAAVYLSSVQPVMRVDSANLAPYENYQVQFKPTITAPWGNWIGGLFNSTGITNSQYLFITNGIGYFRVQNVP